MHYFRKQPDTEERDRCFIMTGSMVSWIDSPVSTQKKPIIEKDEADFNAGKLAIHSQQVWTQGLDADCPPEYP